jgi:hypothetical protein
MSEAHDGAADTASFVRVLGRLECLFNGMAKTVIEHQVLHGWRPSPDAN